MMFIFSGKRVSVVSMATELEMDAISFIHFSSIPLERRLNKVRSGHGSD
jgi:hypothetical protein